MDQRADEVGGGGGPVAAPPVAATLAELRAAREPLRRGGRRIGLVPTMGALHEGHLSLVRASKAECDATVVTIFVNPTQFGPSEDFDRYPRTLDADLEALAREAVDLVFAPAAEEVYPSGFDTWVEPGRIAEPLEGRCRPGHFRGVATVVLKLLNMVQPDVAFFGHKDYQQARVIQRMVADLNVPIDIRVCPTLRESDGLAMSSRNRYLSPDARRRATVLWHCLGEARRMVAEGTREAQAIEQRLRAMISEVETAQIDYVALVDPQWLQPVQRVEGPTLLALAVRIEQTRLIDNCILSPDERP